MVRKAYVKPLLTVVQLRPEERLASCVPINVESSFVDAGLPPSECYVIWHGDQEGSS